MDNIRFKIPSGKKLYTLEQLKQIPNINFLRAIKVIDLRSQRNYCVSYRTIMRKFE